MSHHRCDECLSKGEHMPTCSKVGGPGYRHVPTATRTTREEAQIALEVAGLIELLEDTYTEFDARVRERDPRHYIGQPLRGAMQVATTLQRKFMSPREARQLLLEVTDAAEAQYRARDSRILETRQRSREGD